MQSCTPGHIYVSRDKCLPTPTQMKGKVVSRRYTYVDPSSPSLSGRPSTPQVTLTPTAGGLTVQLTAMYPGTREDTLQYSISTSASPRSRRQTGQRTLPVTNLTTPISGSAEVSLGPGTYSVTVTVTNQHGSTTSEPQQATIPGWHVTAQVYLIMHVCVDMFVLMKTFRRKARQVIMMRCRFAWVCMYVCISTTLAQYNPMFAHVYPSRLCNACTATRPKCAPGGRLWAVWSQVCTASADCKLFGHLADYIALTAALAHYAMDKGAFITARQRVGQTIKDLQYSEPAHGRYISSKCPSYCHYSACTWPILQGYLKVHFKLHCIYQVLVCQLRNLSLHCVCGLLRQPGFLHFQCMPFLYYNYIAINLLSFSTSSRPWWCGHSCHHWCGGGRCHSDPYPPCPSSPHRYTGLHEMQEN